MTLLETRLVRIDIPGYSNIACSVYSNSSKIGVLTSLEYNDPGNCVLIPMQGNLKIVVTSDNENFGSVTFPFSLLNESGCLWLPVILDGFSDYIDALPEELNSPKILMYFEKKSPEEFEGKVDEIVETKEKLRRTNLNYQEFIKKSKEREAFLIKSLEEKENEIQDYVEQLSKAQSHIFSLIAEKKHLSDSLSRLQVSISFESPSELKEELALTRQELLQSESKNESLLRKLEETASEWNFIEEESKHLKESDLLSQISQLKQELELKNKEISMLKAFPISSMVNETSSKLSNMEKGHIELTDTVKYSKPQKLLNSVSTDMLPNSSFVIESVQASMISEEDSLLRNSLCSQPCSRGLSPALKENNRNLSDNDKNSIKNSFRSSTISSQNKSRYIPIATSRRANQSVERKK
jgi:hypothetical protein